MQTKPAARCGAPYGPQQHAIANGVVLLCPQSERSTTRFFFALKELAGRQSLKAHRSAFFCSILLCAAISAWCQKPADAPAAAIAAPAAVAPLESATPDPTETGVLQWEGLEVQHISFEGVLADRLTPLPGHLAQAEGAPLTAENLKRSLRQLYETGLYDNIEVDGSRQADGVSLVFAGTPRTFIGTVSVNGASGPTMNALLQRASQLEPGTRLTQAKIPRAVAQMRSTLEQNGYHESSIAQTVTPQAEQQLADVAFRVVSGPRARVGTIAVTGDSGMSLDTFLHHAGLRNGAHVDRDTVNHALDGVLRDYQKQGRLEADVKLESAQYNAATKSIDYRFTANRGPQVKVEVQGAAVDSEHIKRLVPIFQEGSVDEDLLNEGNRRLRDNFQRLGYFDAKVDHKSQLPASDRVEILYTVQLGPRRHVQKVSIAGNRYFDTATLIDLLNVHPAGVLDRHGVYSQALVSGDVSALEAVYRNNGFSQVKVTPETSTPETAVADNPAPAAAAGPGTAPLVVTYHIGEGPQLRDRKSVV